jgi:ABC-type Na+ efflux pump permease subunit
MSDQPDAEPGETEQAVSSDAVVPLSATERRDLVGLGVLAGCWALLPALFGFWLLAEIGWVSERYESVQEMHGLGAAIAVYAVIFGVTAGLGLLPTYAQAFLGG